MTDKDLLSRIPRGYNNRISSAELLRAGNFQNVRALRSAIRRLREKGAIIAATKTDGGGYFVPVEREELVAYVHAAEKQGASTFAPLKAAREKLREGEGQIDIYDLAEGEAATVAADIAERDVTNGK